MGLAILGDKSHEKLGAPHEEHDASYRTSDELPWEIQCVPWTFSMGIFTPHGTSCEVPWEYNASRGSLTGSPMGSQGQYIVSHHGECYGIAWGVQNLPWEISWEAQMLLYGKGISRRENAHGQHKCTTWDFSWDLSTRQMFAPRAVLQSVH